MSTVQCVRPIFAAAVLALVSIPSVALSQSAAPGSAEVRLCNFTFCSADEFAAMSSALSETFGPPGLLKFESFTGTSGAGVFFHPRGFAFGWSKFHEAAGHGNAASEAAGARSGNSESASNPGGASPNGGASGATAGAATNSAGTAAAADGLVPVTVNPEPGTVVLLATALLALVPIVRRYRRA